MKISWKLLLLYTFFVILWGAFVRASGSGNGCGAHWPSCHGNFLLESPSTKTLIEYIHRASSGLYGIVVLVLSSLVIFQRRHNKFSKFFALGTLFFMVFEALLGAKLVLSELVGQNTSHTRSIIVMIHLTNTLLLIACNVGVIYYLNWTKSKLNLNHLKKWLPVLALFFLTGASGALAALGDTLYPSESLLQGFSMDFNPQSPLLIRLRGLHPIFAFSLSFLVIWMSSPKKKLGLTLIAMALTTLVIGLINLTLMAPIYLQMIHLLAALSFWVICLNYVFDLIDTEPQKA